MIYGKNLFVSDLVMSWSRKFNVFMIECEMRHVKENKNILKRIYLIFFQSQNR